MPAVPAGTQLFQLYALRRIELMISFDMCWLLTMKNEETRMNWCNWLDMVTWSSKGTWGSKGSLASWGVIILLRQGSRRIRNGSGVQVCFALLVHCELKPLWTFCGCWRLTSPSSKQNSCSRQLFSSFNTAGPNNGLWFGPVPSSGCIEPLGEVKSARAQNIQRALYITLYHFISLYNLCTAMWSLESDLHWTSLCWKKTLQQFLRTRVDISECAHK